MTAYVFAGLETATADAAAYVDWYALADVPAGTLHVTGGNVPLNVRLPARVFDAATLTGLGVEQAGSMEGAPLSFDVSLPSSGSYLIRVRSNPHTALTGSVPLSPRRFASPRRTCRASAARSRSTDRPSGRLDF